MKEAKQVDFFLGANTPEGFFSFFSELNDPVFTDYCYVIKGCPGSGKSTMMKNIVKQIERKEGLIERIHCSSDPDSFDGVILHDSKTIIADGTPPHSIEPKLPIAYEEVVSLYDCFDSKEVAAKREEAFELNQKIGEYHSRCCRYLAGAALMLNDNYRIAAECTDYQKVFKQARRLAQKEIPDKKIGIGKERKRMLSAFTPKGHITFMETVSALCNKVYLIKDEYSAASRVLIRALKEEAINRGYDLFCCYCPLGEGEKPEHLLIPELGLGFVTQNSDVIYPKKAYRVIHYSRFTDQIKLKRKKQRLTFNKRAARELLKEAIKSVTSAKLLHDDLEEIYGAGVDFEKVSFKQKELVKKIRSYYHDDPLK